MTYVVTEKCIKCKYTDCVEVCPVDCFYEGPNMLVIDPLVCIDCGICEHECPIGAIVQEEKSTIKMLDINAEYSKKWKSITLKKAPMQDAEKYKDEENKFEKYFNDADV